MHNHTYRHTWGGRTKQTRSQAGPFWRRPSPAMPSAGPSVPQLRCSALCRRGGSGTDLISWGFRCSIPYPSAFPPQNKKTPRSKDCFKREAARGGGSGLRTARTNPALPGPRRAALIPQHRRHEDLIPPDNCVSHKYTAQG